MAGEVPPIDDYGSLLDGRVAVVTGGGDGIGGAISRLFAAHGARVEVAEVDEARGERAVAGIVAAGGEAHFTASLAAGYGRFVNRPTRPVEAER